MESGLGALGAGIGLASEVSAPVSASSWERVSLLMGLMGRARGGSICLGGSVRAQKQISAGRQPDRHRQQPVRGSFASLKDDGKNKQRRRQRQNQLQICTG